MKRLGIVLVLTLVVAACGGDDSSSVGSTSDSVTDTQAPASGETTTSTTETTAAPGGDGGSSSGLGDNTAVVTIGDDQYEFDMTPAATFRCDPNFFGAFWGIGQSADDSRGSLEALLPPVDDPNFEDPPRMIVKDEVNGLEWKADPEYYAQFSQVGEGKSQVESWTIDGRTATGVATFLESNAVFAWIGGTGEEPAPVEGTFQIVCADS